MEPAKRSLTPTLSDVESPLKKSRSDSDPDMSARDVHGAVNAAYATLLDIFRDVSKIPVDKWSSLQEHAVTRMQFVTRVFKAIIKERCPDFRMQLPDKVEEGSLPSTQSSEPDESPRKPNANKDKLLSYIRKLTGLLQIFQKELQSNAFELQVQELAREEDILHSEYKRKVKKLKQIKPPEFEKNDDLLVECPHQSCTYIEKIQAHKLYERDDVQKSFKEFLVLAQKVYNHYLAARMAFSPCESAFQEWRSLHGSLWTQLQEAKSQRLYRDDAHAQRHVDKVKSLCKEQHVARYTKPKDAWNTLKPEGLPLVACKATRVCGMACVSHAIFGTRPKSTVGAPIEDVVTMAEMTGSFHGAGKLPLWMVADGHGGNKTSELCKDLLPLTFAAALEKYNPHGFTLAGILNAGKRTCLELHNQAPSVSGTTLLFATLIQGNLYVFSVGDSRGLLIADKSLEPLTCDADPSHPYFKKKVELRRGTILETPACHRVAGVLKLNLTRTIGDKLDARFLIQTPFANPVSLAKVESSSLYLLLYSDGISAVASDVQLFEFIRELESKGVSLEEIASSILQRTLAAWSGFGPDKRDDISLVIVKLR